MILGFVGFAALGTLLRAYLTAGQAGERFPLRTLAVNLVGTFLLGLMVGQQQIESVMITVGALGSLTTFSTVIAESAALLDNGKLRTAMAYLGVSLVLGVAVAALGINLGELWWPHL